MSLSASEGRKALSTSLKVLVSFALLGGMVYWVGVEQLVVALRDLDPGLAFVSFLFQILAIIIGGLNVMILVFAVRPDLRKGPVFVAYIRTWIVGAVAPGRLGDLSLAHFLAPQGVTYGLGLAVVLVDKLITFLLTVLVGGVGILLYIGARQAALATVLGLAIALTLAVVFSNRRFRGFVRTRLLGKHSAKFAGFSGYVREMLSEHPGLLAANVGVTVVRTIVLAATVWFMLLAFGQSVRPLEVLFVQTIAQLAAWVPISLGGLGVRESTSVVLYSSLFSLPAAPVLNANLLSLVLSYLKIAILWVIFGFGTQMRPKDVAAEIAEEQAP